MKIPDGVSGADQDVRAGQKNHGLIFGENFLHTIIELFALRVAGSRKLLLHEAIDFGFPGSGGMRLRRVPKMSAAAGEPDIHVGSGVGVKVGEAEKARVILFGLHDTIEERAKLEGHDLDTHAKVHEVVLNEVGHFEAVGVGGAGDDGEGDGMAGGIEEGLIVIGGRPGEASFLEEGAGAVERTGGMRNGVVDPTMIAGSDRPPKRSAMALIDEAYDGVAVNGGGNGLAEFDEAKPGLITSDFGGGIRTKDIEIEEEEIEFEAGTGVSHGEAALLTSEGGEIIGGEAGDEIGFAGLETEDLGVGAGDKEKVEFIEIRKAMTLGVSFPIVGIAFENELFAGDVGLQAKRAEADDFSGGSGRRPEIAELALQVGLFEKMTGKNSETVKETFAGAVRPCELENDSVGIEFAEGDGLSANDELVALGGVDMFVEIKAEGKNNVVSIERVAIGEAQALAKSESVAKTVGRNFPGLGESGLRELIGAVDMDKVGLHGGDDFAGRSVGCGEGIESFRLGTEGDNEAATRMTDFTGEDE